MDEKEKWTALIKALGSYTKASRAFWCNPVTLWRWRDGGPMFADDYVLACELMKQNGIEPIKPPKGKRKK